MKKALRLLAILTVITLTVVSFASCSDSSKVQYTDSAMKEKTSSEAYGGDLLEDVDEASGTTPDISVKEGRKIIEYVTLNVQTKEYDSFISLINDEVARLGGYIESSNVTGGNLNYDYYDRSASFKIRIPKEKSGELTEFVSDNSTVTGKETTTDDVTLEYVDTESRVAALTSEKEALDKMLSEASSIEDIITIRTELSDVIYQIESYKSRLRTLDDLTEYSTVTLNVNEVEEPTVVEKQSRWDSMWSDFSQNFKDVTEGLLDFGAFLVSSIPYFLVIGIIGLIIFLAIFIPIRSTKKKRAKANENKKKPNVETEK